MEIDANFRTNRPEYEQSIEQAHFFDRFYLIEESFSKSLSLVRGKFCKSIIIFVRLNFIRMKITWIGVSLRSSEVKS